MAPNTNMVMVGIWPQQKKLNILITGITSHGETLHLTVFKTYLQNLTTTIISVEKSTLCYFTIQFKQLQITYIFMHKCVDLEINLIKCVSACLKQF